MKRILVIMYFVTSLFSSNVLAKETIYITTGEWSPYTTEKLRHKGIVLRIISAAFELEGVNVKYSFYPWQRALNKVKNGNFDATAIWYHDKDREKYFYHSNPVMSFKEVFFHLKSYNFNWNKWEDLKGQVSGGIIGFTVTKLLKEKEKEIGFSLETVASDEINFKKLLRGRINIFPAGISVGNQLLSTMFTKDEASRITYHNKAITQGEAFLLFSKKVKRSPRLLKLFNNGLKKLKESGKYKQFFDGIKKGEYSIKI